MQTDLAHHRNMQPDDDLPSKTLLYAYSKYRKEREDAAQAAKNGKGPSRVNKHH